MAFFIEVISRRDRESIPYSIFHIPEVEYPVIYRKNSDGNFVIEMKNT